MIHFTEEYHKINDFFVISIKIWVQGAVGRALVLHVYKTKLRFPEQTDNLNRKLSSRRISSLIEKPRVLLNHSFPTTKLMAKSLLKYWFILLSNFWWIVYLHVYHVCFLLELLYEWFNSLKNSFSFSLSMITYQENHVYILLKSSEHISNQATIIIALNCRHT